MQKTDIQSENEKAPKAYEKLGIPNAIIIENIRYT